MIQPPRRNLPPDAEPWGRWVEGLLLEQNSLTASNGQSINNTLRGVNASLQQLGNQIQTLSAQQADITDLIDKQVIGASNSVITEDVYTTETATAYSAVSVTVPAGFTKATVMAVSSAFYMSTSGIAEVQMATRIAATDGAWQIIILDHPESASTSHAATLTGLTPGNLLTASTLAYNTPGDAITGQIVTTMMAIFQR